MTDFTQSVTLRAATADDREFLLAVFAGTRSDELAALGADSPQGQAFVQMQFAVQQKVYSAAFPGAENSIILLANQPVGGILVERSPEAIHLVDIAILPEYRNRRIGSFLLRGLMAEAAASRRPLELSVYRFNPAARLYERLGFSSVGEDGLKIQMQWLPAITSAGAQEQPTYSRGN